MAYQHYTDTERDDADKVEQAIALIDAGKTAEARAMLEQVAANCPEFYVYDFGTLKEVHIKFWSLTEYLGYIALTRIPGQEVEQEVIWLKSAYPRAYYHLARLELLAGNDDAAAAHLDKALLMEPDHPECLMEMAEISVRAGDSARAVEQFDLALGSRPYMPAAVMPQLLAGKAKQLAVMGRYEEAERCLQESLKRGADGELAMNLQQYIESVEAGDVTAPVSLDTPPEEAPPEAGPPEAAPQEAPTPEEVEPEEAATPEAAPQEQDQPEPPEIELQATPPVDLESPAEPPPAKRRKRWWQFWRWWR